MHGFVLYQVKITPHCHSKPKVVSSNTTAGQDSNIYSTIKLLSLYLEKSRKGYRKEVLSFYSDVSLNCNLMLQLWLCTLVLSGGPRMMKASLDDILTKGGIGWIRKIETELCNAVLFCFLLIFNIHKKLVRLIFVLLESYIMIWVILINPLLCLYPTTAHKNKRNGHYYYKGVTALWRSFSRSCSLLCYNFKVNI